jgi:hypothetical protein
VREETAPAGLGVGHGGVMDAAGGMSLRNRRTARAASGLALGASIAALLAACSPGADYPSILDKPAPRADQTMNPDQVRQATDALISDRNRLSNDTQASQQAGQAPQQASAPAATGSTRPAGSAPKP